MKKNIKLFVLISLLCCLWSEVALFIFKGYILAPDWAANLISGYLLITFLKSKLFWEILEFLYSGKIPKTHKLK